MSITWNGVSSDTIGVIVERIPNRYVPTRRFSPQQVAGRNGNILLVDKSFPNVEQEYEVYLSAEAQGLPSVARACAEWLMGPDGYCRLEDSYDTTVYREAFLMGGYDLENILNKFGRCTITFSCKPQKYLLAGDTPIEIPAGSTTTYTGSSVQFDGITGASITSLSATIEPTQDLHGYSSPWPAGGGKNLVGLNTSPNRVISYTGVSASDHTDDAVTLTSNGNNTYAQMGLYYDLPAGTYTFSIKATSSDSFAPVVSGYKLAGNTLLFSGCKEGTPKSFTLSETTAVNFRFFATTSDSTARTVTFYDVQLESGSTATSWTPYSNICPISGRTGVSVYRTGKNLYMPSLYSILGDIIIPNKSTVTIDEDEYVFIPSGTNEDVYLGSLAFSNDQIPKLTGNILVEEGETYTVTVLDAESMFSGNNNFIQFMDKNNKIVRSQNNLYIRFSKTYTFTVPQGAKYVGFRIGSQLLSAGNTYKVKIQLELGSTATDYEPYQGDEISVNWETEAGTVYGGTLDVTNGVLTVTHGVKVLDGSENWAWSASNNLASTFITNGVITNGTTQYNKYTQNSTFKDLSWARRGSVDGSIGMFYGASAIYAKYSGFTTEAEAKSFFTDNPTTVVYELATPITYQLTPQEIEVLVGENNVWSSSGPVSVTVEAPFVGTVTNPTPFEARPMLEVSGVGEITINGKTIQILEAVSDFNIDCESMEAEDNSKIYCIDFPELSGGENEIVGDGSITALTVTPRWWTL